MNFEKKTLVAALALVVGLTHQVAQAATPAAGDILTISPGVVANDANGNPTNVTVSWFGMDTNGNTAIAGTEKTALSQGTGGLVIGSITTAGAHHAGAPTGSDTNVIDNPWNFFGNTGSHYNTVGITGSTTAGLNFSGWYVAWSTIDAINMNTGAWGAGFSNGVANFTWDGVYGDSYVLEYTATVPLGDPSGFGGVKYKVHLQGVVNKSPAGAPTVVSTLPANAATGVPSNLAKIVVNYDKAMGAASLAVTGTSSVGAATCTTNKLTCVFPVVLSATGSHTVSFGGTDTLGNALVAPGSWAFTSVAGTDSTAPSVASSPTGTAVDSTTTSNITLTFSEEMDPVTVASALTLTKASVAVAYVLSTSDNITYTVAPTGGLLAGATYTVALSTTAQDLAGNALPAYSATFSTVAVAATTTTSGVPASGGAGGGCAMNPASRFDLSLLLVTLAGLGYASWKRKRG